MKNVLAMALAGGRGERMGPLCDTRAKPALTIGGDLRVIDFGLSNCIHSGIKNIAVITGYQGAQLARYVTSWAESNNGHSKIHILEPKNATYSGTADAVWQNINIVKRNGFEWIIVLPADHVSKMNFQKLLKFHIARRADVTVAVARVQPENAHRYGIVASDADGRVLEFKEKPPMPAGNLASMGIYVFNRQALLECLASDACEPYSPHDFGYSIMPAIVNKKAVYAYPFMGFWRDIGTVESYYQTNLELIDRLPLLNVGRKWQMPTAEHGVNI
ncbi:MAG: sugar phosphate nucleotidyltransferase [Dehalococcoidia bacterium]